MGLIKLVIWSEEKPLWIVPVEVIKPTSHQKGEGWLLYREILKVEGKDTVLKTEDEMNFQYG